jgi:EpsI family protein
VPGDGQVLTAFEAEQGRVDVAVVVYRAQRDGREAAAAGNAPTESGVWEPISRREIPLKVGTTEIRATETRARTNNAVRLIVTWYESGNCTTASRLRAKICSAQIRLRGLPATGAFVALSTEAGENPQAAEDLLREAAQKLDVRSTFAPL